MIPVNGWLRIFSFFNRTKKSLTFVFIGYFALIGSSLYRIATERVQCASLAIVLFWKDHIEKNSQRINTHGGTKKVHFVYMCLRNESVSACILFGDLGLTVLEAFGRWADRITCVGGCVVIQTKCGSS